MDLTTLALPRPQAIPTPAEWNRHREKITTLYLDANMKLREVARVMKEDHNFGASEAMYKKRIAKWNAHKNYKSHEKEIIAASLQLSTSSTKNQPLIRGRPVKLDRIIRYQKHLQSINESNIEKEQVVPHRFDSAHETKSKAAHELTEVLLPITVLHTPYPQAPKHLSHLLRVAELDIRDSLIASAESICPVFRYTRFSRFLQAQHMGEKHLQLCSFAAATHAFGKACDQLQGEQYEVLISIATVIGLRYFKSWWSRFPEYRASLFRFFHLLFERRLGRQHPLTNSLLLMWEIGNPSVLADILNGCEDVFDCWTEFALAGLRHFSPRRDGYQQREFRGLSCH